jgi:hypothetical protein
MFRPDVKRRQQHRPWRSILFITSHAPWEMLAICADGSARVFAIDANANSSTVALLFDII